MPRGPSKATAKAAAYIAKHPTSILTAEQLADKFGLNPATVYRAEWWKVHRAGQLAAAKAVQQ